tara:strand:+ start:495 stop:1016 length:522 start_codon:yes stop_codon:yes gene_type:complete
MKKNNYAEKYNWSITYEKKINVKLEKLWQIISIPSYLESFHPFCNKNIPLIWSGKNSVDEIHYCNGHIYNRYFIDWKDLSGYDLLINRQSHPKSLVKWKINKHDDENCSLKISIYPYIFNTKNKLTEFLPFYVFIYPKLKKYLEHIFLGLEWYIKTNKQVSKNQFGTHAWFSK